jgi:hypothetical protein
VVEFFSWNLAISALTGTLFEQTGNKLFTGVNDIGE